jgi:DNA polymerase-3 subunit epsilon
MSWTTGRLIGFDIESTSTDPETARIVSAAIVICGGGLATETVMLLSDVDGEEIPEEATKVHGITTEHARRNGLPAKEVVQVITDLLAANIGYGPLVVFRAPFDLTIADREARRHEVRPLFDRCAPMVLDPFVLDKHLDPFRKGKRTLTAMCEHRNVTLDGAHDASFDALAACRLAYRLGTRGEIVRNVHNKQGEVVPKWEAERMALGEHWARIRRDLSALHDAQRTWAFDQSVSLAQHFEEKGEPQPVSTDWPLIPVRVAA